MEGVEVVAGKEKREKERKRERKEERSGSGVGEREREREVSGALKKRKGRDSQEKRC
jgi:hypothetical protein